MQRAHRVRAARRLACSALAALLAVLGCPSSPPAPVAGAPDYQAGGFVDVPLARVNALGGNLFVKRVDLDLDTRLGNLALGATWSSAARAWRWSFELEYDGARFVDATGAVYDASAVANGAAIPGSVWVKLDARTLRSKGGLVHEFGADGRLAAVRWASGAWPRLEYHTASTPSGPRVSEVTQVASDGDATLLVRLSWDAAGRLTRFEDRAGRRTQFTWNGSGQLVQARDAFDLARGLPGFRYGYADGALVSIETSEGVRAEYAYASGRVASARAVGLDGPELRFAYAGRTSGGFETRVTDALGGVKAIGWDRERRATDVTNAVGERTRWTWSGLRPTSVTAPDGATTRWLVADDDVVEERQPSGRVIAYAYQPTAEDREAPWARPLGRASDALGVLLERAYDAQGRLVRQTNGAGESTAFAWSGQNLLSTATDPAGLTTRYADPGVHGHPRRIERGGVAEDLDYDAVGNLLVGRGNGLLPPGVVSRGYDEDRNLAELELGDLDQAVSTETRALVIDYRSDGQVRRIDRPFGGDSEFVYDALGRLVERRDKADGVWRSTRLVLDALGRPTELERPNGMRSRFEYDAASRAVSVAHLRGGRFESGASLVWRAGRVEQVLDAAHAFAPERYAYDAAGRVASVTYPDGERLELGYDGRSRVASERYRLGSGAELRVLGAGYDGAGRQTELRDGATLLVRRAFSAGRLAREELANGLARSYSYDGDGFLATAELRTGAGALVERSVLEREVLSGFAAAVAWRASTSTFGALEATTSEHYWLAPVGDGAAGARVGGFAHDAEGANVVPYAYDALGNLLRVGSTTDPAARLFVYDAERTRLRRIRLAGGGAVHDYTWDEAGFALTRDGEALSWDGGGRPTAVGDSTELAWDALGRPVSVTVDGVTVRMLFGGRVRADARGTPVAIEAGTVRIDLLGNHHFRHFDFRGNVKLVTDAAGRVVFHARYGPYGVERVYGAADPEAGFAQGRDAGGGLVLLGARLYDPDAGRFLAPDPVFQLVSQYAYADGNPVWFWDPDGQMSRMAIGITAGIIGMHVGIAVIAVAAVPATVVVGATAYTFAAAFTVGVAAPGGGTATGLAGLVAGMGGHLGRATAIGGIAGAAAGGFGAGQLFMGLGVADKGGRDKPPPSPDPDVPDGQIKVLTVERVGPGVLGGPSAPAPGCSPASLAESPRWDGIIARLVGVQAALALLLLWSRARDRAGVESNGES